MYMILSDFPSSFASTQFDFSNVPCPYWNALIFCSSFTILSCFYPAYIVKSHHNTLSWRYTATHAHFHMTSLDSVETLCICRIAQLVYITSHPTSRPWDTCWMCCYVQLQFTLFSTPVTLHVFVVALGCSFASSIGITYTLEAELFSGKMMSRVWFKSTGAARDSSITETGDINPQDSGPCTPFSHLVYLNVSSTSTHALSLVRVHWT